MAKHMAGKNQRPYSAEDRARRAAKADPRSAASELTPETLYAKQSSQSEKRVPSSIENLHFTPKPPKNGPEGFEETREYPAPAGYDSLLTNMYGDYMKPPEDDEKSGHFTSVESDK